MLNCVVPSRLKKTPLTYSVIACNVATAMGKNFSWFSVFTTFKRESVSKSTLNGDNLYHIVIVLLPDQLDLFRDVRGLILQTHFSMTSLC